MCCERKLHSKLGLLECQMRYFSLSDTGSKDIRNPCYDKGVPHVTFHFDSRDSVLSKAFNESEKQ